MCAKNRRAVEAGPINTLVFHYDLLRPFGRPVQSHGRDPALHLLSSAEKITVITLFNSAEELVKRKSKSQTTIDPASRHRILLKMYRNSEFLDSWYEAWFDEMQKYASSTVSSLHVRTNDNYDIVADHIISAQIPSISSITSVSSLSGTQWSIRSYLGHTAAFGNFPLI